MPERKKSQANPSETRGKGKGREGEKSGTAEKGHSLAMLSNKI